MEKGNGDEGIILHLCLQPRFSYVSINTNTISEQMGFTLSQLDAPVSWIGIISVMKGKEDAGHAGVSVSLSAAVGRL